jgi:hypothetical protein
MLGAVIIFNMRGRLVAGCCCGVLSILRVQICGAAYLLQVVPAPCSSYNAVLYSAS